MRKTLSVSKEGQITFVAGLPSFVAGMIVGEDFEILSIKADRYSMTNVDPLSRSACFWRFLNERVHVSRTPSRFIPA